MSSRPMRIDDWKLHVERAVRTAIVIACYLIVFMGLLFTVAGGAGVQ